MDNSWEQGKTGQNAEGRVEAFSKCGLFIDYRALVKEKHCKLLHQHLNNIKNK
jgi:hypothetical protein